MPDVKLVQSRHCVSHKNQCLKVWSRVHLEQSPWHCATHHLPENSWYLVTGGFVVTFCYLIKCECVHNTENNNLLYWISSLSLFNKDRRKSFLLKFEGSLELHAEGIWDFHAWWRSRKLQLMVAFPQWQRNAPKLFYHIWFWTDSDVGYWNPLRDISLLFQTRQHSLWGWPELSLTQENGAFPFHNNCNRIILCLSGEHDLSKIITIINSL